MSGGQLVPHRAQRLSRKKLREWLSAEGPQPLGRVLIQAKLQVPAITKRQVERELRDNPELFLETEEGLWAARPRERYVMVAPRPRPEPRPRKKPDASGSSTTAKAKRKRRSATADRHPPRPNEPVVVERGRVACVTFRRLAVGPGEPLESGRHLLVPMPQEAEPSPPAVVDALLAAFGDTRETDVYEVRPGIGAVYRGRRAVLHVRRSPDGGRVHVVLGPGVEDEGHVFGLVRGAPARPLLPRVVEDGTALAPFRAPALPPASGPGTGLAPSALRRAVVESIALSETARRSALLPPPTRRFDRAAAYEEATRRLAEVRLDSGKWPAFHEWLAGRKSEYDQELLQRILQAALGHAEFHAADAVDVLRLAQVLIEPDAELDPVFARTFCIALSERLSDPDAMQWAARLRDAAARAGADDPELELAAARIALDGQREADACRLYRSVFARTGDVTSAADLEEYLFASALVGDKGTGREALEVLEARLDRCTTPGELHEFKGPIDRGVEVGESIGDKRAVELLDRLLLLLLESDEAGALETYLTRAHRKDSYYGAHDRLRLLSTLARCEDAERLRFVLVALAEALEWTWDKLREPDREAAVEDVRQLERLLGDVGHPTARTFEERLARTRAPKPAPRSRRPSTLAGRTVVLLGGRATTRQRVRDELVRAHDVAEVHEIPPSWEASVDEAAIRARVTRAHYVVEITDCIKHDTQRILRELEKAGLQFEWVRSGGGTTRIVRDLATRAEVVAKRESAGP